MPKHLLLSWLLLLPAIVDPCHAKTLQQWEDCLAAASSGQKAQEIERESGVDGLHQHALKLCGFRPTGGRTWLPKEDCDRLFEMTPENDCKVFGAGGAGDRYLKTLDPRAFDEDRYWALCERIQAGEPPVSRQQFGREVCGERLAGNGAPRDAAITANNWISHPKIVEVRSLYQTIEREKSSGGLDRKDRRFEYCEPYEDLVRTIYTDRGGRTRIYYYEGGSDDSTVKRELYYDESGTLRFALITAAAHNGTLVEHRAYFSETGQKIWEIQKRLEGPGYPFPTEWPDAELIKNPIQAFNDKNRCTETK